MVEEYNDQHWKFQRREKRRKKQIEHSRIKKVDIPKISKKDIIKVTGYKNNNQEDTFEIRLSGKNLTGHKDEYKKITELARIELKVDIVKVLEVVTD